MGSGVGVTSATAISDSAITDTAAPAALLTFTVTGVESLLLPTLSVARAMSLYWPLAGWLVQLTE